MDYIDYLIEYGLTRQEAIIYVELMKHGSMTGYEVSKETGISKSNIYAALKGLTQKGAAVCEEKEATRYIPVSTETFCENHLRYLGELKQSIVANQPKKLEVSDGYITIQSAINIRYKIIEMLNKCQQRVYIMAESDIIKQFDKQLAEIADDNKKVVVLTDKMIDVANATTYVTEVEAGQIRFIVDSSFVLTGSLTGDIDDTCLYSGRETLVNLVKENIKNKMPK